MQLIFVTLALTSLALGANSQACGITGTDNTTVVITAISELVGAGTVFAQFQTFGVKGSATVAHPFNKYLTAQRYTNGVYELVTSADFPEFLQTERQTVIERSARFTCEDDTSVIITFEVGVKDENNNHPVFDQESYSLEIQLPLIPPGEPYPISAGILVSDADVDFANADLYIMSSNRNFGPVVTKLWEDGETPEVYSYRVDFIVDPEINDGIFTVLVTADDGAFPTTAVVNVVVSPAGTPEPEPTEPPTTTTQASTTPEIEPSEATTTTTTTEEPTTTTTTEATTTTTTTTVATTTTQDPTVSCGIVGILPGMVEVAEQSPSLPTGTQLYRGRIYNVESTTSISHPHNGYSRALRTASEYWIETTASYPNFVGEQGSQVLQRIVNFFCVDGSQVQYQFRIPIEPQLAECRGAKCSPEGETP